ncbi:SMC-Scp complex subunit ScpB [Acetilactobacillus jinshanensis]|uniref:SMC-Scp complex subunit ScpB n=1 Tax=Acetilactobacillus jinshanensis TaxID=1720083 RepID=UPI0013A678AC|nr:SMC-Scp complex subunit ScpB [Acetilactobacillus jinshanensis]URL60866.1 SMC-Scp complex subunit ScpB [uncultured bacterium]
MITKCARVEGLLYVTGDTGLTVNQLVSVTSLSKNRIELSLKKLNQRFSNDDDCPFQLLNIHGRYQLITKKALNVDIQRYFKNTHTSILTSAALETLTIIAYNQPVTRIEVDDIRGVNSSVTIEKLLRQKLIKKAGRKKTLGNPIMFKTTDEFLNLFGLKNIKQLPKIKK